MRNEASQQMDTRQIRFFVTLAETLNFSEAASVHGVTQPALTKAIQRLEEDIGGSLIHRDGKDTRLTSLGHMALADFEAMVESEDRARELADVASGGHQDKIRIGIASTIIPQQFSSIVKRAIDEIPNSKIVLDIVKPNELTKLTLSGKLDCCFWSDFGAESVKLSTIKLYSERLLLACSSKHRFASMEQIPMRELEQEKYLERLNCEFRHSAREILARHGTTVRPVAESAREDWIQHMVANNLGVTTLPEHSRLFPELIVKPITDLNLSRNVHFITISGSSSSDGAKKVENIVKATLLRENPHPQN